MLEFNWNKKVTGNSGNDIEVAYSSVLLSVVSISGSNSKCVCVSNRCKSPIFKYQMFIEQLHKCLPYLKFQWNIRCVALQCTHVHSIGPLSKHLDGIFESITWHLWFVHFFLSLDRFPLSCTLEYSHTYFSAPGPPGVQPIRNVFYCIQHRCFMFSYFQYINMKAGKIQCCSIFTSNCDVSETNGFRIEETTTISVDFYFFSIFFSTSSWFFISIGNLWMKNEIK